MGQKLGAVPLWRRGSWVPIPRNVARADTYLHTKFHLDQSNRLDTIHQRYSQDRADRQTDNGPKVWANCFTNGSPKCINHELLIKRRTKKYTHDPLESCQATPGCSDHFRTFLYDIIARASTQFSLWQSQLTVCTALASAVDVVTSRDRELSRVTLTFNTTYS